MSVFIKHGLMVIMVGLMVAFVVTSDNKRESRVDELASHIEVEVNGASYIIEYAQTDEARQQGLMYRESLCENCGMLFNFGRTRSAAMWMKNTFVPLSVAYITKDGEIISIQSLIPQDLTAIRSPRPVHYAWEMSQGWFRTNRIDVGDIIRIHPVTP